MSTDPNPAPATCAAPLRLHLPDEAATAQLGTALGRAILAIEQEIVDRGFVIGLSGDLGAGKTALVRASLRALGVEGRVKSPTFSLLEVYVVSRLNFYHFDFYRLERIEEFREIGFREAFGPGHVCAIEWPERAGPSMPQPDLQITLQVDGEGRVATMSAATTIGASCLQRIRAA